jgi:hypothetical protein
MTVDTRQRKEKKNEVSKRRRDLTNAIYPRDPVSEQQRSAQVNVNEEKRMEATKNPDPKRETLRKAKCKSRESERKEIPTRTPGKGYFQRR